ncbi:fatty acid desaturase [Acinetobacter baumannii]|uniref:fatty acid desaturase n=1 Tax=Acinetobacter baumannii TaxID=470 RepID=UPI00338F54A9
MLKEPRETMEQLPSVFQPFLTWLTGAASKAELLRVDINKKPPSPIYHVVLAFLKCMIGVVISYTYFYYEYYILLIIGWIITVSGMRKLQVVIYHNCAHGMIFNDEKNNRILGWFISIVLLIKNYDQYKVEHLAHHSSRKLLTRDDDTLVFLMDHLGINSKDSVKDMWRKLLITIFSPIAHIRFLLGRLNTGMFSTNISFSLTCILFWSLLVSTVFYFNIEKIFVIIWMVPLIIGYQISATLRLVAEHRWPPVDILQKRERAFISLSTSSVFLGRELKVNPEFSLLSRYIKILLWWGEMLSIHLFFRLFVLVGDTPCHDYHHRRPTAKDWTRYAYARKADQEKGCVGHTHNYLDSWGYIETVNSNFKSFSEAAPYYQHR